MECPPEPAAHHDILIAIPSSRRKPVLPVVNAWMDRYVVRNVGSTALHLAYVACGAVDAALCHDAKLWDVAAGILLVTEAGGRCTDFGGQPVPTQSPAGYAGEDVPTLAAAPLVFSSLLDDLRECTV